jgi:molybdate transport system ATP-binding protein
MSEITSKKMNQLSLDIHCQLDAFELEIKQTLALKGITGIYGRSGSGKSTLLRIIAGLNDQASGQITFDGLQLLSSDDKCFVKAEKRQVSMVFQDSRLFPHLTVLENLQFAVKRRLTNKLTIEEIIKLTELESLIHSPTSTLSGGEQQRVALARAILVEPKLLLLDEPLSALDYTSKNTLLQLLNKVSRQLQLPIFYVSHSLAELQQIADKLVVLDLGKIKAYGGIHQVIHQLNDFEDSTPQLAHQQTSLSLPFKKINQQHQLITLTLGNEQEVQLPISPYLSSQLKEVPQTEALLVRCFILATDISICLTEPTDSSIVNQLFGKITAISTDQHHVLVTVNCQHQVFFISISSYSLDKLALRIDMSVYLQFKASAVRTHIR